MLCQAKDKDEDENDYKKADSTMPTMRDFSRQLATVKGMNGYKTLKESPPVMALMAEFENFQQEMGIVPNTQQILDMLGKLSSSELKHTSGLLSLNRKMTPFISQLAKNYIYKGETDFMDELGETAGAISGLLKMTVGIAYAARYGAPGGRLQHQLFQQDIMNLLETKSREAANPPQAATPPQAANPPQGGGFLGRWM